MFEDTVDEFWFWKKDRLKFDDAGDNFEEEEGFDVSEIEMLLEIEDTTDIL